MPSANVLVEPGADDMRWQDYEELVKDIYQALGRASGVVIECWGRTCRVLGQSGVYHQIDVLTSHSDGLIQYRTAISCKYWNRKVGKSEVVELIEIVRDANLSKGVIVSKMGFTRPAKDYAAARGIGLVELRRPLDKDWDGYIRNAHITLTMVQSEIYDVRFGLTVSKAVANERSYKGGPINWRLRLNQIFVGTAGEKPKTMQKLADEAHIKYPDDGEYHIEFPEGSILTVPDYPNYPANGYGITSVNFKVRNLAPLVTEFVVRADDHIYMIMESVFDGRRFTISNDGEITEDVP